MDQGTFGPQYAVVDDRVGVRDWTMHASGTAACCSIRVLYVLTSTVSKVRD